MSNDFFIRLIQSKIDLINGKHHTDYYSTEEIFEDLDELDNRSIGCNTKMLTIYLSFFLFFFLMVFSYRFNNLKDIYRTKLSPELNEALYDCIRHHQMILKTSAYLEDLISPFILVKSLATSFQICVLALTVLKV